MVSTLWGFCENDNNEPNSLEQHTINIGSSSYPPLMSPPPNYLSLLLLLPLIIIEHYIKSGLRK